MDGTDDKISAIKILIENSCSKQIEVCSIGIETSLQQKFAILLIFETS